MSCNGCRVLRKGCSEACILRPCLQWIESAEAQGHATVFVAKFFGRAGLMSFISSVPESQRPALFQSLLFEACGRTVNPVNGAVGLLWTGNWHACQTAVETVLKGGTLRPLTEIPSGMSPPVLLPVSDDASEVEVGCTYKIARDPLGRSRPSKRRGFGPGFCFSDKPAKSPDLDLCLTSGFPKSTPPRLEKRRSTTPSMNSEGSVTTSTESGGDHVSGDRKLLNLFV